MNAPIEALYQVGATLYAVLVSQVNGQVWNQTGQAWENYNSGHWSDYAVPLTEYSGSGYYRAAYPISAPTFLSSETIFVQAGGSPTLGDPPATSIYQSQGANIAAVGNNWGSAQNMSFALGTQQLGAISGTPATPFALPTNLTSAETDTYAGRAIIMTSGMLAQQASFITAYNGSTFVLTIQGFPSGGTPANMDTFVII
jgi:hypothetical protein